jgi:leucyl-tRNA synthetase
MNKYTPRQIEAKWQQSWEQDQLYKAIDYSEKPKYVMLTEFPYPSGDGLHLGHVREYTLGDIMARFKRMQGFNVLYPMGYDAFGLPTENFAIKNKIAPQVATERNVANFKKQFVSLGFSIDWSRSFKTTDPSYYKWTQWLFLQFYKHGMAYQANIAINWCPKCKTGLANEEVVNGKHERCDTVVEKKQLKQWMLKITKYADKLIDGLSTVDYPSRIADQQINWIGRSKGAEITFGVLDTKYQVQIFTTRPDTLFGATFMVLAPEHPIVEKITTKDQIIAVTDYIKQAQAKSEIDRQDTEREKTGVFTGAYAINPVNNEHIPIWIADYVLLGYGTGAIMAVPAHDERDHDFAIKFNLKETTVFESNDTNNYGGEGVMINSGVYNGLTTSVAREKIVADLQKQGIAKEQTQYRLRDWIFSRQHYWGEPIPIIHCPKCGAVAVPEDKLPITLPDVDHYEPTDNGESPLASIESWVSTTCPTCHGPAKRETDTMPNWAGSSWYYLRYYDARNDKAFADRKKLDYWGAVDMYLGGMEHTTLHLLYSRFWHQFFYDIGLVPTKEPYSARRGQGIILATDGSKMSKSKGNVINPNEIIDAGYGADALRLSIAFLAPYDMTTPWNQEGVAGTYRFLSRIWNLVQELEQATDNPQNNQASADLNHALHKTIKKVSHDLHEMAFNTAIASLMECVNDLYKIKAEFGYSNGALWQEVLSKLTQLVAPFAPHIAEELWQQLGNDGSVHVVSWPTHDEQYLLANNITIAVQVNGKLRGEVVVEHGAGQQVIEQLAKNHQNVANFLTTPIKKVIYVPAKLINFVV